MQGLDQKLTNGEAARGAAGFVEPIVGSTQNVLVKSNLPAVVELDRNVRVLRVVVPACWNNVSRRLLY